MMSHPEIRLLQNVCVYGHWKFIHPTVSLE